MEDTQKLHGLRVQIDKTDEELVALLNRRAALALEVKAAKNGAPVYRPEREAEVIRHVLASNSGPLSAEAMETLFRAVIAACRAIQGTEPSDSSDDLR